MATDSITAMLMLNGRQALARLLLIIIVFFAVAGKTRSSSDIECLRSIKSSLRDPQRSLSSWKFINTTTLDSFCSFNGVECWPDLEMKIRSLRLGGMGLAGEFPRGIAHCTGLTSLDLSRNKITGSIPADISRLIASATVVDLSHCKFSGEIPADVANCKNLSVLMLNNNFLTGRIPAALASLRRLSYFTVANNSLAGPVPRFEGGAYFPREMYAHNAGLCGGPLGSCEAGEDMKNALESGLLAGWCVSFALFLLARWYKPASAYTIEFFNRKPMPKTLNLSHREENTTISRLEKFATRMSVAELRQATGNFSDSNIIAVSEMGATYKAMLSNGWHLAVKRLSSGLENERKFLTEIMTVGRLRHRNLVPIMGFCQESLDRFIIYKLMPNGTLHDRIFCSQDEAIEWPLRAKIAVGIARGIAWLHANGIVHRGITSKCIMLDEDFNPRVSDFGKATVMDQTDSSYGESWELGCHREDVHGFGKVLLELMTCRLYSEIIKSFDMDENMLEQISAIVMDTDHSMPCLLKVAAICLECDPCTWPTMEEVCSMLTPQTNHHFQNK